MPAVTARVVLAALALALSATASLAQYPNRIVRIVAPAPPGGSTDIIGRLVQPGLQELLKQTVIVEARGGAGGYIGSDYVAKSPADGYTLLVGGAFTAITASMRKQPAYNPRKDLVPVAIFASVPNVLVVGPHVKATSVAALVADVKANPGKRNMGSNGVGTTLHLSGELFQLRTGTSLTHIPFKGWGDCVVALMRGDIDIMFDNVSTALPNIASNKFRPLAVTAPARHRSLPDTPTLAEVGVKDAEVLSWFGIMVPAGTPQAVIDTLSATLKTITDQPEVRKLIEQQGMDAIYHGPADAAKFWHGEIDKWEAVTKAANLVTQ
ncbi:MAG: tripartite tricarboxylate transporter substrate binding protein [Xanthobacteraceae bacterium]|nr:tripartite tricarboxylate transporter substrate binding protein [Xanthobacteraceae bacterium]